VKVIVRRHLRRKPDFGDLRSSVPPGTKVPRRGKEVWKDPVTGKYTTEKKESWQIAEELLEKYGGPGEGSTAMWKAEEQAEKLGLHEVTRALELIRDEDEPAVTLQYGSDEDEDIREIKTWSNNTDGDFEAHWVSTDAWRGYYEVKADPRMWTKVHEDTVLAMSEDEQNLMAFDEVVRKAMDQAKIRYVRAVSRTSNLFSAGYDLFVEADQAERIESLINILGPVYRDPKRVYATAMTGKDPRNITRSDVAVLNIAGILLGTGKSEPEENKREMVREQFELAGMDPSGADNLIKMMKDRTKEAGQS